MGMLGQQQTLRWKNTATKGEKKFGKEKKNWKESLKERKRNGERMQNAVKASCSVYQSDLQRRSLTHESSSRDLTP